jgi:signal transduction histidine kinase
MRRGTVPDALLAVVVAASTASGDLGGGRSIGDRDIAAFDWSPPLWFAVPLGLLAGAALWWRRNRALLALALVAWVTLAAFVALIVALYSFAERTRSRGATVAAATLAAAVVGLPILRLGGPDAAAPLTAAICFAPALLGLYTGTRRDLIAGMRERAERAEREQHERVLRARSDERAQIAQDMHDVVTHRVSLIVLHATALEASEGRDAAAIGRRIGTIGREALEELRSLVQVLRAGDAPLGPQPGLADLADLVEECRRGGMRVTLTVVDEAGSPPPALAGHAVYRVVQEALTNVRKHAGGAESTVVVRHAPEALRLSVTNGRGRAPVPALPSGGHGLLGIAERVRLLGGDLTAGPTGDGGYRVSAEVPL